MGDRVLVILGMHRAGTSLTAQLAGKLGVDLGVNLIAPRPDNLDGLFEQIEIMRVSKSINRLLDRRVMSPLGAAPFPDGWMDIPEVVDYQSQLREILQRELSEASRVFGFKDPNSIRILPLWQRIFDELDVEAQYVLSVRHPVSVTKSLMKRDRISKAAGELLWCIHYAEAIDYLQGNFSCVVSYEGWYSRPEKQLKCLSKLINLPSETPNIEGALKHHIKPVLTHQAVEDTDLVYPLTKQLYTKLDKLASGLPVDGLLESAREILSARELLGAWVESLEGCCNHAQQVASIEARRLGWMSKPDGVQPQCRELRWDQRNDSVESKEAGYTCIVMPEVGSTMRTISSDLPVIETRLWELAKTLGSTGSKVTVLFPRRTPFAQHLEKKFTISVISKIKLVVCPQPKIPCRLSFGRGPLARALENTYNVYEYLKIQSYGVVFVPDFRGIGYFSLVAKSQGINLAGTSIVLLMSQPASLVRETNKDLTGSIQTLIHGDMESKCLNLAENIICTDSIDVEWLQKRGWQVPEVMDVLPLPVSMVPDKRSGSDKDSKVPVSTRAVAFFGNLDQKSGIHVFCGALQRLAEEDIGPEHVYFISEFQTGAQVNDVKKNLSGFSPSFYSGIGQKERVEMLTNQEVVVVVPVSHHGMSAEALECMMIGARLLVSDCCPHLMLLSRDFREQTSVSPHPYYLSEKLKSVLKDNILPVQVNWNSDEICASWIALEKRLGKVKPSLISNLVSTIEISAGEEADSRRLNIRKQLTVGQVSNSVESESSTFPDVSVCLIHFERPYLVNQAIESLELQSYKNFEVILVDDGSKSALAIKNLENLKIRFEKRGWKVICQPNLSPGAARNRAASVARGQYLLFMDDDNYAKPHEIETFLSVATRTKADAITCFSDVFNGGDFPPLGENAIQRIPALGSSVSVSAFINCFGDTNALVRKQAYLAVGGYNEQHRTGKEDYEFFCKLVLKGFELITIPEALYWYREHPVKRKRHHYNINAGTLTILNAFSESVPYVLRDSVIYGRALRDMSWDEALAPHKIEAKFKPLRNGYIWKFVRLLAKIFRMVFSKR